jgi:hypothetical protein
VGVIFASPPILFGMSGSFVTNGVNLTGGVRTFSDAVGEEQGESRVVGYRIPCQMPKMFVPPPEPDEDGPLPTPPAGAKPASKR